MATTMSVDQGFGALGVVAVHPGHHRLRITVRFSAYLSRTFALDDFVEAHESFSGPGMTGLEGLFSEHLC